MAWARALPDALDRLPDDRELVDVEHDPREVANQKHLKKATMDSNRRTIHRNIYQAMRV